MAGAARLGPGPGELALLEKLLGLPKGNKYGVQGERKVPVLQTNSGPGLTGLMTIAAHLVKQAKKDQLLGSTAEEKAVVQQWLEYRVTRVDGGSSKEDTRIILKVEAEKRISKVTLVFEPPDGRELNKMPFKPAEVTFADYSRTDKNRPVSSTDRAKGKKRNAKVVIQLCEANAARSPRCLLKIPLNKRGSHGSILTASGPLPLPSDRDNYFDAEIQHFEQGNNCVLIVPSEDLNVHLEDKVYLAGNIFTLADILMYYGLHHIMVDLTVQEKEKYLNVSRWFNHIQHYPGVRQHLSNVVFIKNRLYTNAH